MIDPEKEREDFISIREVVGLIAGSTGKTERQAASFLLANLHRSAAYKAIERYSFGPYGLLKEAPDSKKWREVIEMLERRARGLEWVEDDIPF